MQRADSVWSSFMSARRPAWLAAGAVAAALAAGVASSATAADAAAPAAQPAPTEESQLAEITVTGSRILRRDLDAPTPVVTVESEAFKNSAYTSVEQVLNELPQFVAGGISGGTAGLSGEFNNADVQPSATNSPGAATVNLRGLGCNRSLTLIDGRRGQPSNASLCTDLNTIPSSAIQSVEVITGGASSTYGADALGGVTNFKLRDNFKGFELSARGGMNDHGNDGKELQISSLLGAAFGGGDGNAMVATEWYQRHSALRRNRQWFSDAYTDSTMVSNNSRLDYPSVEFTGATATAGAAATTSSIYTGNAPNQTVLNNYFSGRPAGSNINIASVIYFNRDNSLFLSGPPGTTATTNGNVGGLGYDFNAGPPRPGTSMKLVNSYSSTGAILGQTLSENDLDQWLSSPEERFSIFGRAKYKINDHIRAYTQANFVSSTVDQRLQPTGATGNFAAAIPHGSDIYLPSVVTTAVGSLHVGDTKLEYRDGGPFGLKCPTTGGCTLTQAFPVPDALEALLNSRAASANCVVKTGNGNVNVQNPLTGKDLVTCGPNSAWKLSQTLSFLPTRGTSNDQRLYQITAGFEGDLGLGDWTWEAFATHGDTLVEASYIGYPSTFQYRSIVQSPNYGKNYLSPTILSSKKAVCTTGLPEFSQFAVSADCISALVPDTTDRSNLRQDIYEANLQGGIWELPGGQLRGAMGVSSRTDDYVFRPDATRATDYLQDVGVGQFGAVRSGGKITVNEVYGELLVPVLRGLPFAHSLDLELGYRYSDYSGGTGSVPTYKMLATWAPVQWMNIRGGYQKANRAPNIAELYQGETTIVTFATTDPCRTNNTIQQPWYNNTTNTHQADLQRLCSQQIDNPASDFDANPAGFTGGGGGLGVQLGNPNLKSESASTWTVGSVFRSPFDAPLARSLSLTLDYYSIKISNTIAVLPDRTSWTRASTRTARIRAMCSTIRATTAKRSSVIRSLVACRACRRRTRTSATCAPRAGTPASTGPAPSLTWA